MRVYICSDRVCLLDEGQGLAFYRHEHHSPTHVVIHIPGILQKLSLKHLFLVIELHTAKFVCPAPNAISSATTSPHDLASRSLMHTL